MFKFLSNLVSARSPKDQHSQTHDRTVDELITELRQKSDTEIMARLRFREHWIKNWCAKNPYAKVPSSFLQQFAALDRVGAERMVKLMNEIRVAKELRELDLDALENHLADSYRDSMK